MFNKIISTESKELGLKELESLLYQKKEEREGLVDPFTNCEDYGEVTSGPSEELSASMGVDSFIRNNRNEISEFNAKKREIDNEIKKIETKIIQAQVEELASKGCGFMLGLLKDKEEEKLLSVRKLVEEGADKESIISKRKAFDVEIKLLKTLIAQLIAIPRQEGKDATKAYLVDLLKDKKGSFQNLANPSVDVNLLYNRIDFFNIDSFLKSHATEIDHSSQEVKIIFNEIKRLRVLIRSEQGGYLVNSTSPWDDELGYDHATNSMIKKGPNFEKFNTQLKENLEKLAILLAPITSSESYLKEVAIYNTRRTVLEIEIKLLELVTGKVKNENVVDLSKGNPNKNPDGSWNGCFLPEIE